MTENKQNQKSQETPNSYKIAEQFLYDKYTWLNKETGSSHINLRSWKDDFYAYEDGCYHPLADSEISGPITEYLDLHNWPVTITHVKTIMMCLHYHARTGHDCTLNSWLDGENGAHVFPMANGNVSFNDTDPDTGKPRLLPHTPKYFTLSKVPYDYDHTAKCPNWEAFLHDVLYPHTEYIRLLQQWAGYLFQSNLNQQKFLLCYGEGANGKSVFFDVIESLVGESNCSHLGLHGFNPTFSQFALHSTLGKTVNISTESSHLVAEEGETILKSYVAGDEMQFERKHRDAIMAKPTAKIMIATNALPRFNDKSNAIWRRPLIVPFLKEIKDKDQIKNLPDLLKHELSGIFNWSLEGMKDLEATGEFIVPEESKRILEEYRKDSDPARAFLLEFCTWTENGYSTPCSELYSTYFQWCKENGYKPTGERYFGRSVKRLYPKANHKRNGGREERVWVYDGLVSSYIDHLTGHGAERTNDEKPLF